MVSRKVNILTIIGFIIPAFIVYFTLNKRPELASNLLTLSFFYVFVVYIVKVLNNRINQKNSFVIAILSLIVFTNVVISGSGDFNYFKKSIMFITTIVWIICSYNTPISKRSIVIILLINIIINYLYVLFFQSGFSIFENQVLLSLNFSNPNQAGMFILNSVLYLGIAIFAGYSMRIKKKYYIISLFILIPLLIKVCGLLILTGCRSSYLSVMLFVALVVADLYLPTKKILSKPICFFLSILPFIFVFIYLWKVGTLSADVSFGMEESGKSSTTRVSIWKPIIDNFFHYFLFGDYYGISNGTGMSQMHNTHLDVFASYGIIPLVMYCGIIYRTIRKFVNITSSKFQAISLYAFISCQISGTFEASFVSGGLGLFFLTVGFLILANYQPHESFTNKCASRPRKYGQNMSVR